MEELVTKLPVTMKTNFGNSLIQLLHELSLVIFYSCGNPLLVNNNYCFQFLLRFLHTFQISYTDPTLIIGERGEEWRYL